MPRASGFVLVITAAAMGSGSAWAQKPPAPESPQMMYRMGAANEAALRCRDLRIIDKDLQSRIHQQANSVSLASKAMAMGIEDFEREYSAAYTKGREQEICNKYLLRYPSILTRR
jgi:hypothetical protein